MKLDRRDFLKLSGVTGLAGAAALMLSGCGGGETPANTADPGSATNTQAPQPTQQQGVTGGTEATGNTADQQKELEQQLAGSIYYSTEYLRDKVVVATNSDGGSFDPFARTQWGSVTNPLNINAIGNNNHGDVLLMLLKRIDKVDNLTYDWEFWDSITDSVGNNFTASDAAWSVEQYVAAGNAGGVNCLDHVEVLDTYKLRWHLKTAFGPGDLVKNFSNSPMIVQKSYEDTGNDMMASKPSGLGPYDVVGYVAGNKVVFEAKDDYWFRDIYNDPANAAWLEENLNYPVYQNVKTIEWDILQDAASRATALEMGSVDAVDSLNAADVNYFVQNPSLGVNAVNQPVTPPLACYFNCNEASQCSDVNLRKAICTGIDNQAVADGLGIPAYPVYGILPNQYDSPADWLEGREYYDYDPDAAKALVEASGYDGSNLVVIYISSTERDSGLILIDAQMSAIGVHLELYPVTQPVINTERYDFTKWDILFDTFGGGSYLPNVTKRWWSSDSAQTLGTVTILGIEEPTLDALYEAMLEDNSEANIKAWDDYFTYEQCYGYGVCGFFNQTAAKNTVNVALYGSQSQLCIQAFTYND